MAAWIIGNLDFEASLGGRPLSHAARRRIAGLAALLRVFACAPGDRVWTPGPVDPARVPPVPGLPDPPLVDEPLDRLAPASRVLAWGETGAVARLRRAGDRPPVAREPREGPPQRAVWALPSPRPEVAARVNHRAFALSVAAGLDAALPGARFVSTAADLVGHLAAGGANASPDGAWVLKAPWSAAGRDRVIARDQALEGTDLRRRVDAMLRRHGSLLFEPWMPRLADFGASGWVDGERVRLVGVHRQHLSDRGGFAGIDVVVGARLGAVAGTASARRLLALSESERTALVSALEDTGAALLRGGYTGPFGVDAWRYRDAAGGTAFHKLGEINARLTFGWVARATVDRVAAALGWDEGPPRRVSLRVGRPPPDRPATACENDVRATASGWIPLLLAGADDETTAWLAWSTGAYEGTTARAAGRA